MFNGLNMNLGNLSRLSNAKTRSISAENFTGQKGGGGRAEEGTGKPYAAGLGHGWKISPSVDIQPGTTFTLAEIDGPGAIQSIWITGRIGRFFILRIYWDHQEIPSVECPLTDFFAFGWNDETGGPGGGFPLLSSLPVTVAPCRGMSCFWEMPFRRHCRITLEHIGHEVKTVYYQINYTLTELPEDIAYFHAHWRRTNPVPYRGVHTVVEGIRGKGQFVGMSMLAGLNGTNGWWGEGEAKFYLDGDTDYPTICGTGLEDYFLGAYDWISNGQYVPYSFPFAGMYQVIQPDGALRSQQRFAMYRWHVMDPIRFETDLRITFQDLGWRENHQRYLSRQDDITTVAYWYQTLPSAPLSPLPDWDELEII